MTSSLSLLRSFHVEVEVEVKTQFCCFFFTFALVDALQTLVGYCNVRISIDVLHLASFCWVQVDYSLPTITHSNRFFLSLPSPLFFGTHSFSHCVLTFFLSKRKLDDIQRDRISVCSKDNKPKRNFTHTVDSLSSQFFLFIQRLI